MNDESFPKFSLFQELPNELKTVPNEFQHELVRNLSLKHNFEIRARLFASVEKNLFAFANSILVTRRTTSILRRTREKYLKIIPSKKFEFKGIFNSII